MDVMRRPPCSSDDRPTSALRSSPSLFRTGTGVHDAGTHEGLRAALAEIGSQGWDSEAGRAVMYSLTSRCAGWSAKMSRNPGAGGGAADPGDVLSLAWLTLDRFARNVAAADAPWAYLWTAVGRAMAVDAAAAAMLSERAVRRARSNWPVGVHRLGADDVRVGPTAGLDGTAPGLVTDRDRDRDRDGAQSPAAAALVRHLAGSDPSGIAFWADAVDRALEVMASARRSYEEVSLRRDLYLRDVLSLSGAELAALGALLIGPRRGDRAAQSLLLALHRDPTARPEDVVGAVDRIAFLQSRRHAATGALPNVAAA